MRAAILAVVCAAATALFVLGAPASAGPLQEGSWTLSVSVSGKGHVTSNPSGIDCPSDCDESYEDGTTVKLTAAPSSGWVFEHWGGNCSGTGTSCTVNMTHARSASATFGQAEAPPAPQFGLTVTVVGDGSVASSPGGISCGGDCSESYDSGTAVTLAPLPGAGSSFVSWSGDCSGSGVCSLTINSSKSATATFSPRRGAAPETQPNPEETGDQTVAGDPYRLELTFLCYSQDELFVAGLYQDVLKRRVDQGGLDFYVPKLDLGALTRTAAALSVLQSVEYRTMLLQSFYMAFLHRSATPAELAAGLGALAGGASDEDIKAMLLGSSEYLANRGGGTTDGFLDALFQDVLGRLPTSAERASYGGLARDQAAMQLLASTEARTRLIQADFAMFLHRNPTDAELNLFLGQLGSGVSDEGVAAGILGSDEYLGMADQYEGTVNWGDGTTSPGKITRVGKTCTFSAMHTYTSGGNRLLETDVTAPDGSMTMLTLRLKVEGPGTPPPMGKENVVPSGRVLIKVNGKFVPLTNFKQVPFGTELDTTNGMVKLTSHDGSVGTFYEGQFIIQQGIDTSTQAKAARRVTQITLSGRSFKLCATAKRAVSGVSKPKPKPKSVRHVWGNAKGGFRTKGRFASATVRGTLWRTDDLCTGTLVTVRRGKVDVFDFVKRRHFLIPAGRSYLAKH
jgi:hypothetical protein